MLRFNGYINVILLVILFASCKQNKVVNNDYFETCRRVVLSENKPMREYIFKSKENEIDRMYLMYLGNITTKSGDTIKFINQTIVTGLHKDAERANSSIYVYDNKHKRIGFYYVGGISSLASRVENHTLVFDYTNTDCNEKTVISFKESIPKEIYVRCSQNGGDLYKLSEE